MRLLQKNEYMQIENLLRNYDITNNNIVMQEVITFFDVPIYKEFLKLFYFERYKYKNRYKDNRSMLRYLSDKLYVSEPQLYMVRKEIVYKSAMIFYKYGILK